MQVNDHYHRPKRKILQKVMEAMGQNPEKCISQSQLDKYSELDNVIGAFLAVGIDPQASGLRQCKLDPPDCQAFDESGNLVGWEETGLYNQTVERINAEAKPIRDKVYWDWNEEDLVAEITRMIREKDAKITRAKAKRSDWPYAYVNLVIPTDELGIPTGMAEEMRYRFVEVDAKNIKEVYLLLSYDAKIKKRPCVRLR
jgi:hypothetical protein